MYLLANQRSMLFQFIEITSVQWGLS